jgi:hemerythrin-like domain-containing protein
MRRVMKRLLSEHQRLGEVLRLLEGQAHDVADGDDVDFEMTQRIADFCGEYLQHFHHPLEDILFARLLARCPEAAEPVRQVLIQHVDLAREARALQSTAEAVIAGSMLERRGVAEEFSAFVRSNLAHRAREEEELFPLCERWLSEDDWETVERVSTREHGQHHADGTGPRLRREYQRLLDEPSD